MSHVQHSPAFIERVNAARRNIRETDIPSVSDRILNKNEHLILVDVREDDEFRNGTIPGAIHIGKGVIERDIEVKVPDKTAEIILFCGGGVSFCYCC